MESTKQKLEEMLQKLSFSLTNEHTQLVWNDRLDPESIVSVSVEISRDLIGDSLFPLVANHNLYPTCYFKNKTGKESLAVGALKIFKNEKEVDSFEFSDEAKYKIFGAFQFSPDSKALTPEWKEAQGGFQFIPFLEFVKESDNNSLKAWFHLPASIANQCKEINFELVILNFIKKCLVNKADHAKVVLGKNKFSPDKKEWEQKINYLLENVFCDDGPSKVVLARKEEYELNLPHTPPQILNQIGPSALGTYCLYLAINPNWAFMGHSPEKLFSLEGGVLEVDALAGTRPRGKTESEDLSFENDLLASNKEKNEHRFVVRDLERKLFQFCDQIVHRGPSILKLSNVMHLHTQLKGQVHTFLSPLSHMKKFHPTPAVGGHPTDMALDWILNLEPFERGLYAAPFGVFNKKEGEFSVALRCLLLSEKKLHFFAGAGIVPGSSAESEWNETSYKLSKMLSPFSKENTNSLETKFEENKNA